MQVNKKFHQIRKIINNSSHDVVKKIERCVDETVNTFSRPVDSLDEIEVAMAEGQILEALKEQKCI